MCCLTVICDLTDFSERGDSSSQSYVATVNLKEEMIWLLLSIFCLYYFISWDHISWSKKEPETKNMTKAFVSVKKYIFYKFPPTSCITCDPLQRSKQPLGFPPGFEPLVCCNVTGLWWLCVVVLKRRPCGECWASLILLLLLYSETFDIKYREVTLSLKLNIDRNWDTFNIKTTQRGWQSMM